MLAMRYTLISDKLYKQGFNLPLLKCITPEQGQVVLREIHEGVWQPHRRECISPQNSHIGLFLANFEEGHDRIRENMLSGPKFCTINQSLSRGAHQHPQPTSIRKIGDQHHRTTTNDTWESQVFPGRHGLFHQIGRGRGPDDHRLGPFHQVYIDKHHLQIRPTVSHCI